MASHLGIYQLHVIWLLSPRYHRRWHSIPKYITSLKVFETTFAFQLRNWWLSNRLNKVIAPKWLWFSWQITEFYVLDLSVAFDTVGFKKITTVYHILSHTKGLSMQIGKHSVIFLCQKRSASIWTIRLD